MSSTPLLSSRLRRAFEERTLSIARLRAIVTIQLKTLPRAGSNVSALLQRLSFP